MDTEQYLRPVTHELARVEDERLAPGWHSFFFQLLSDLDPPTTHNRRFRLYVLLLRGIATVEHTDCVVPEYAAAAKRYFGPKQGSAWVAQLEEMGLAWARIGITPTHATVRSRLRDPLCQRPRRLTERH